MEQINQIQPVRVRRRRSESWGGDLTSGRALLPARPGRGELSEGSASVRACSEAYYAGTPRTPLDPA